MDLSCIISSGDLELYVLGLLPDNERQQIEQLITIFPEIKEEVDRICKTLEDVANQSDLSPDPALKEKLFQSLNKHETKVIEINRDPNSSHIQDLPDPHTKVIPIQKRSINYLTAASIAGLILAASIIAYLANQNNKHSDKVASLEQKLSQQQQQTAAYVQLQKIVSDENFQQINLEEVAGKPNAIVKLFWNKLSREVFVVDVSLPSPPSQKQYQLWAIVDGKPVNAGMLTDKKQIAQKMQGFEKADAFAITLEKYGGSEAPTLEEMYVMGKAS